MTGLRARLTLGTAFLLALAVATGFLVAYLLVRDELQGQVDRSLAQRAAAFVRFGSRRPARPLVHAPRAVQPRLGAFGGYVQFVRASGAVVLPPGEADRLPVGEARLVAMGRRDAFYSEATVAGTHLRLYTARLRPGTALEIARPLTEVDHLLGRLRLLFLAVSLLAVGGAAAVASLVSRAVLRPVRRLTEHAERIAATGDLDERTDGRRSDELGRLAVAFNTMLDALAASVRAQRQLVADASHELRTPLAAARTNLETIELHDEMPAELRKRAFAEALDELRELTVLIDELVELARGDVQVLETQPTRLDLVVEEAVALAERRSGRNVVAELEPTIVDGSPTGLARAVGNLLDNAVEWGPPDAPIEVVLRDGSLSVRDHGPGIDPADLPHVFDRFYRAPAARSLPGSGLGLAIVRQIVEAHGGTAVAEAAPGAGTVVTLRFPTAAGGAAVAPPEDGSAGATRRPAEGAFGPARTGAALVAVRPRGETETEKPPQSRGFGEEAHTGFEPVPPP